MMPIDLQNYNEKISPEVYSNLDESYQARKAANDKCILKVAALTKAHDFLNAHLNQKTSAKSKKIEKLEHFKNFEKPTITQLQANNSLVFENLDPSNPCNDDIDIHETRNLLPVDSDTSSFNQSHTSSSHTPTSSSSFSSCKNQSLIPRNKKYSKRKQHQKNTKNKKNKENKQDCSIRRSSFSQVKQSNENSSTKLHNKQLFICSPEYVVNDYSNQRPHQIARYHHQNQINNHHHHNQNHSNNSNISYSKFNSLLQPSHGKLEYYQNHSSIDVKRSNIATTPFDNSSSDSNSDYNRSFNLEFNKNVVVGREIDIDTSISIVDDNFLRLIGGIEYIFFRFS